jgi:hypothetical protein
MKYPKRSQYKQAKSQYRVRNWAEYEEGLQRRGDLTVWLSDEALDTKAVYEAANDQGEGGAVRVLIPPKRDAQLSPKSSAALQERDRNIRLIRIGNPKAQMPEKPRKGVGDYLPMEGRTRSEGYGAGVRAVW